MRKWIRSHRWLGPMGPFAAGRRILGGLALLGVLPAVVAGLLVLSVAASANTSVSPTSLNFGSQPVGTTSGYQSVTVTVSCSTAAPPACTDQGHFVAAPHFALGAANFVYTNNNCGDLFSGPLAEDTASCQYNLAFKPSAINNLQGVFRVGSDVSPTALVQPGDISLTGFGTNLHTLTVNLAGSGSGHVTGTGIDCPGDCTESYNPGTVSLTAAADGGSSFTGWSGAGCSGTGGCNVTVLSDQTVTATFADATPPTASAPAQSLVAGNQLGATTVPVRFDWTASDNLTPPASIQSTLQQRTNSSTWSPYSKLFGPTPAKTATASLPADTTLHQLRISAKDGEGNLATGSAGPMFRVTPYQESSSAITYSGTWQSISKSGAFGDGVRYSTQAGAKATLTSTGRNLAVVMPRSSTGGTTKICLDPGTAGQSCSTVDLSPVTGLGPRKEVFVRNGLSSSGNHKVQVTVMSGRVDLDAFVALR